MKFLRIVFLAGVLLALAVPGLAWPRPVIISGTVYQLTFEGLFGVDFGRRAPVVPFVDIRLVDAATGEIRGTGLSDANGRFRIYISRNLVPLHLYAVLTKPGFKTTASFIFHVADNTGVDFAIVDNVFYDGLVRLIDSQCRVLQDPNKSLIIAFFQPEGLFPDWSPHSPYRGAALHARAICNIRTILPKDKPEGTRVWYGHTTGGSFFSLAYDTPGFIPVVSLIVNAARNTHPEGAMVKAYCFAFLDLWPRPQPAIIVCPAGLLPGLAPTPFEVTVGVVSCRRLPVK